MTKRHLTVAKNLVVNTFLWITVPVLMSEDVKPLRVIWRQDLSELNQR